MKKPELSTIKKSNVTKTFSSGALSGCLSTLLLQPLEVAKTQLQVNRNLTLWNVNQHILQNYGLRGFWRGTAVSLYRNMGGMSVFYPSLYILQSSIYGNEKPSPFGSFALGGFVRSVNCCIFCPLNVVKTRLESGTTNLGILSALMTIYQKEGVGRLFSGLMPTIARDLPHAGLNVMFYWEFKSRMKGNNVLLDSSISGFAAALLSCLVTHPFDVVKTNMQNEPGTYPNIKETCAVLWNRRNIVAFYLGFVPRTGRKVMLSMINWVVLEFIVTAF